MAIQTNIPLTNVEKNIYKKFKSLSVNEEPLPQGDGQIRISPFDDYFIFTIFDERDGENAPVDLSNVGTLYMSFIGSKDEIRIPNFTNVQNVDMSQGQILFKITKENSKKILALDSNSFFISTLMKDDSGESDESVLYYGTFLAYDKAAQQSLTGKLEDLTLEYTRELGNLTKKIEDLQAKNAELQTTVNELALTNQTLTASNEELTDEVGTLSAELGSKKAEIKLKNAAAAQQQTNNIRNKNQQIIALNKKGAAGLEKRSLVAAAAKSLQNFIPK